MATTLKAILEEEHLLLSHNYRIEKGPTAFGGPGGYQLFCGDGFIYGDKSIDKVMSRYCMQVVDDCIFDTGGL